MQGSKSIHRVLTIMSGIGAPFILFIAIAIAGSFYLDYSHLSQAVSVLGAIDSPYRSILNYGGLIPAGILTFVFSIMMFHTIRDGTSFYICAGLVAVVGISRILAGIFPCDEGCLAFTSTSAKIHAAAGISALAAGAIAPLILAVGLRSSRRRDYFRLSLSLGFSALIALAAGVSQLWPQYMGLFQRTLLVLTYIWIVVIAIGIGIKRNLILSRNDQILE